MCFKDVWFTRYFPFWFRSPLEYLPPQFSPCLLLWLAPLHPPQLLWLEMKLFSKKHHTKWKNIHNSAKANDILIKNFFLKAYDLLLLFLKKKLFLFWAWLMGTPFLHKLGQKIVIFKGFNNFFSELVDSN